MIYLFPVSNQHSYAVMMGQRSFFLSMISMQSIYSYFEGTVRHMFLFGIYFFFLKLSFLSYRKMQLLSVFSVLHNSFDSFEDTFSPFFLIKGRNQRGQEKSLSFY